MPLRISCRECFPFSPIAATAVISVFGAEGRILRPRPDLDRVIFDQVPNGQGTLPRRAWEVLSSAAMERPGITELAIKDQLKTKRNSLFNEFLRNPLNTSLAIEIKSIDDRIAELTGHLERKQASEPD